MVGFFPFLFKGMGPHELPVAQVVYLAPLLLGHDTGQVLLPSLKKDTNKLGLKEVSNCFRRAERDALRQHDTYKCEVSLEQTNPGCVEENQSSLCSKKVYKQKESQV